MYENFYNLDAKAFSLLPNPAFLFMSQQHAHVMSTLEYAINNDAALSVVTGDVGAGKTAVALYAMLVTIAAGKQTALMAPTEVLARQQTTTVLSRTENAEEFFRDEGGLYVYRSSIVG